MACSHGRGRFLVKILDEDGNAIGVRCESCGSTAYRGESLWTLMKRNVFRWRR